MKVGSYAFTGSLGIGPQTLTASETTSALAGKDHAWTLYVVATAANGTTFNVDVQDSADGSTGWADLAASPTAPADNSVVTILVRNNATRGYTRLNIATAGSPVASVAVLQLSELAGSLTGGCDVVIT